MIFLDTSGVCALADKNDLYHEQVLRMFENVVQSGEEVLMHNYILVESAALLQRRLSQESSLRFLRQSRAFTIHWVESELHQQAVEYLEQNHASKLSFVDVVSFLVMRSRCVTDFIGFDKHFIEAGFTQYNKGADP